MLISLIGYRGTGKSTVARQLALLLGEDWVDADVEVELRAGKSIAAIFADDGEPAFRDLEARTIADLAHRNADKSLVLACGGGAILREATRDLLRQAGKVVWLRATVPTLLNRIAADATTAARRPSLTAAGGVKEIEHLLSVRTPLYESCANLTVDTDDRPSELIAREIAAWLRTGQAATA